MSDVTAACQELAHWLPEATARTHIPDTDGTTHRGKPGTRPPWNQPVAAIALDIHEGVRRIEDALRYEAGLPVRHRGGSDRNTGLAIRAIRQLSHTADRASAANVARTMGGWTLRIRQLPQVDDAPTWHRIPAPCPYCGHAMLRIAPKAGLVTCLRYGVCEDSDGNHPSGRIETNRLDATPCVTWNDGLVT